MPLSRQELEEIRAEAFAEDMAIPAEAQSWSKAQAVEYFESGGMATEGGARNRMEPSFFEVVHSFVNVRSSPELNAAKVGTKVQGRHLQVDRAHKSGWVRLSETFSDGAAEGWLLVEGAALGLGTLLKHVSGPSFDDLVAGGAVGAGAPTSAPSPKPVAPAPAAAAAAVPRRGGVVTLSSPLEYEVVHPFVRVRTAPSATASELEGQMKRKGTVVTAIARCGDWVQLEPSDAATGASMSKAGGWMLVDGKALTPPLGFLLKPRIVDLPEGTRWTVTRPAGCVGYRDPAGDATGEEGTALADCAEGDSVEVMAECRLWVHVRARAGSFWVDMDCFFAG